MTPEIEGWIETFLATHDADAWGGGYRLRHLPAPGTIREQDARDLHAFAVIRDELLTAPALETDAAGELRTYHDTHTRRTGDRG